MKTKLWLILVISLFLSSCQSPEEKKATQIAVQNAQTTQTALAWTKTPANTATATATETPIPTATATLTLTPTITITKTPLPPSLTPAPCAASVPTEGVTDVLTPHAASTQEMVKNYGGIGIFDAVLLQPGYDFLVVYFEGMLLKQNYVTPDDLNWQIRLQNCEVISPIGLGFPVSGVGNPVLMLGILTRGALMISEGGAAPLIALVYIVQDNSESLSLISPSGRENPLLITSEWLPEEENDVASFAYDDDGYIEIPFGGDLWCSTMVDTCKP